MQRFWISFFLSLSLSLRANFSTETLSESQPQAFLIPNFLTPEECDYLIEFAKPHLRRSTVVNEKNDQGVLNSQRSSEGMFCPTHSQDSVLTAIEERIERLTGMPIENGEGLQILHYRPGGQYAPHFDFFDPNSPGGNMHLARGGQRVATVIMYLNEPEKGGETVFPKVSISVTPKKGYALLFYNCLPNGNVDYASLHAGAPVQEGEKWIATKWIRERIFY